MVDTSLALGARIFVWRVRVPSAGAFLPAAWDTLASGALWMN